MNKHNHLIAQITPTVGLFKNSQGKMVIVKSWQGKIKNLAYHNFLQEIRCLQLLNHFSQLKFRFPKILSITKLKGQIFLEIDYLSGKSLSQVKPFSKQVKIYHQVLSFLDHVSQKITAKQVKIFRRKDALYYLLLFPILWLMATFQNTGLIPLLLKTIPVYFITGITCFKNPSFKIVHGDLNFKNIIVDSNNIGLLDFTQTCFTYPEFEYTASLSALNTSDDFKNYLSDKIVSWSKVNLTIKNRFIFALLNCNIHNLTWHAPSNYVDWYTQQINFAMDLYNNKYV